MSASQSAAQTESSPSWLVVELTNICNLHCSYCLRDEDALYHMPAAYFPLDLLRRVIEEARASIGIGHVSFTGGETTLHPQFGEIIEAVGEAGLRAAFVTNGWHFERVWPAISANRRTIRSISFSLDGATAEAHDRWRGRGSFVRLIRAFTRCHVSGIPFNVKVGLRRDTVPQLEQIAMLAARLGATGLSFSHLLPTSESVENESALTMEERRDAEQEIALLNRVFKMKISIDVGYVNLDPAVPCVALRGSSVSIDYRGRLSLCCNLSGYRGAGAEPDVVADLTREDFASGYARLRELAVAQVERRRLALEALERSGQEADLYTGSPCLFCLQSFGKIPWRASESPMKSRSLPVLTLNATAGQTTGRVNS
jgi:MoaA/NifB/PqqE/SkfB family radical SAM enzyme